MWEGGGGSAVRKIYCTGPWKHWAGAKLMYTQQTEKKYRIQNEEN
jgi:hypothetical protein